MHNVRRGLMLLAATAALVGTTASTAGAGQATPTYSRSGGGCTVWVNLDAPFWGQIRAQALASCIAAIPALPKLTVTLRRAGQPVMLPKTVSMPWNGSGYSQGNTTNAWSWGPKGTRWDAEVVVTDSNNGWRTWITGAEFTDWIAP